MHHEISPMHCKSFLLLCTTQWLVVLPSFPDLCELMKRTWDVIVYLQVYLQEIFIDEKLKKSEKKLPSLSFLPSTVLTYSVQQFYYTFAVAPQMY